MTKVGFIGLGIMGRPMAINIINAGHEVIAFDVFPTAIEPVIEAGGTAATSCAEVASNSEIVITMVQDGPQAEAAIAGESGALEGASPGDLIVDMSSIAPGVSQRIGEACEKASVGFIDAPVSGGEPFAISGDLAIMVGGKADLFERAKPMFDIVGKSSVLCGEVGAGNVTKLANQIVVGANIHGLAEALALATKAGVNPETVVDAIKGGLAGSNVMNAKAPMMIAGDFKPGFRIRLHQKDLQNALLTGKEIGVPLPVTSLIQQMIGSLINDGKGDLDHSGIANFIEDMANSTVSGK